MTDCKIISILKKMKEEEKELICADFDTETTLGYTHGDKAEALNVAIYELENKEEIEKIEEIDFLMKIREISKTHTCSYGAILDLLLEIILHFSTKELVDILEAKRFL